jgi:hypothetical protein
LPETANAKRLVRTMGSGTKPVFLSEYGVGSLFDAITTSAEAAQWGPSVIPADVTYVRSMARLLEEDWHRFGMGSMYCFPEDAIWDSYANQSTRRAFSFDLIRANGNIAGYNLTGMLDHALTGEGSWSFWRRWKPGAMEALSAGWAPLRWCLEVTPAVAYAGDAIRVELSLANEDVLRPGTYPVRIAVVGPGGYRQERSGAVEVGAGDKADPLALPVLDDRITLDGPAGEYRFAASMGAAAAPAAGRATAYALGRPAVISPRVVASSLGLDAPAVNWLSAHGVDCDAWSGPESSRRLVIIGPAEASSEDWSSVGAAVDRGATALVLAPGTFVTADSPRAQLPFNPEISVRSFHDWLYHKECFGNEHVLFDNLPRPGLLRFAYYDDALPRHLIEGNADEIAAFAIAVGYPVPTGYVSGLLAAAFRQGAGRVIVSSFNILPHLGVLAVADHLALNLVRWASGPAGPRDNKQP